MGSYDGAESCEIVDLYILNKIGPIFWQDKVGLYRDDVLAVTTESARQIEKSSKNYINNPRKSN